MYITVFPIVQPLSLCGTHCRFPMSAQMSSNNLLTLDIITLFGKLEEPEQELICLEKHEKNIKKEKNKENDIY